MSEDFIPDILETLTVPPSPSATPKPTPRREPVKISIIGSR
ncbi:MAG: hypothetical protein RIB93_00670 [Coleofasciculus sp. D1-CHI-01]